MSGEKVALEQDLLSQMTKVDDLDVILTREKENSAKLKRDFLAEKRQFQEQIEDLENRQVKLLRLLERVPISNIKLRHRKH